MSFGGNGAFIPGPGAGTGGGASVGSTVPSDVGSAAPSAGASAEASRVDHVHEVLHRFTIGSWRVSNHAADATNTVVRATGLGQIWRAHRACRVVGYSYELGAAAVVTSGSLAINLIRTNVAGSSDAAVLAKSLTSSDAAAGGGLVATPISLAAGEGIQVQTVSVALAPTTLDPAVELEIEEVSAA